MFSKIKLDVNFLMVVWGLGQVPNLSLYIGVYPILNRKQFLNVENERWMTKNKVN